MTARRWFEDTYPAEAKIVILHPNFTNQHLLLPMFTDREDCVPVCVNLQAPDTDLSAFWELLAAALSDQVNLSLPALASGTSVENAAQLALKTMKPLGQFLLLLDAFDLAEPESIEAWVVALAAGLPKGCQIVLGGRRLPAALLERTSIRKITRLFPLDPDRMLLDYVEHDRSQVLLEVYGHGPGRVLVNGRSIEHWDGVLPRSLFFYFIDRGMVTRDEIFRTFWPALPVREATNVYHVTKRKISEILGFDLTVYWSGFYRISPEIELHYDVVKFVENVQNSAVASDHEAMLLLQRAIYLYHGVFLSSLSSAWVETRREELQMTYVDALSGLARLYEQRQQQHEALGLYMRAAATQPHREDLARSIMSLYDQLGQPQKAIDVYNRLVNELNVRLSVTPDRRTVELAEQIRATLS